MTEKELHKILSEAIALPAETEIIEFKEAKESYDFDRNSRIKHSRWS